MRITSDGTGVPAQSSPHAHGLRGPQPRTGRSHGHHSQYGTHSQHGTPSHYGTPSQCRPHGRHGTRRSRPGGASRPCGWRLTGPGRPAAVGKAAP